MNAKVQALKAVFPASIPFPSLLAEFVEWAEQFECGQLGWFEFEGQRLNDYWIENGSALAERFALFIQLPEGSMIGFWKPEGQEGGLPVVLLVGEGAQEILGSTLEEFLWNWAKSELSQAYDLMPAEDSEDDEERAEDARPALKIWLEERAVTAKKATVPDIGVFFDNWQEKQGKVWLQESSLQNLGKILEKYAKPEMSSWQYVDVQVRAVKEHISIKSRFDVRKDEKEILELCQDLRSKMVKEGPERGLWFSAWIMWYPRGYTSITAEYISLPEEVGREDALADLKQHPRNAFWTPDTDSAKFRNTRKSVGCSSIPQNPYFFLLPLVGLIPQTTRNQSELV